MTELQENIRIVIPAFNSSATIQKCIDAILDSICFLNTWEIIIVDNGQNPDLSRLFKDYPLTILKRDKYQSAAYARNEGAKGFINGILIFIDSDVICEKECIKELIAPLQNNLCHATIGNYSRNTDGLSFSQKYKQLYISQVYNRGDSTVKNDFWSAICSVDAKVFKRLGGFNSYFKGANGEDQEFGIRLTKYGYKVLTVKHANGQHLNPYGVLKIVRNDFRKGLVAVKNSLENKVPFSDNRHSKKQDILSVLFAVLTVAFLMLIPISIISTSAFISSFVMWFAYRIDLSRLFLKYNGIVFFVKALLLMFTLDLIRCMCVIVAVVKYKILKVCLEESEISKPVSA